MAEDEQQSSVFDRVVVGVDGSEPGFDACRQAAVLAVPDAPIAAVSVVQLAEAVHVGPSAPVAADRLAGEGEAALARAVEILGDRARTQLVDGSATKILLREVARTDASVVAVGTHGRARATAILLGSTASELLHSAPCSVLVARPPADGEAFPGSILVGIDGSDAADEALAAAQELARRFDAPLRILVAGRGKDVDLPRALASAPTAEQVDESPVAALVDASGDAGLVVIGSRGLSGVRALGSVSERVAHRAACSVLVVRSAPVE